MIDFLPKTILVPLDEDEAYTGPVEFVNALYPKKDRLTLILHYIEPQLAPVYKGTLSTPGMREKKKDLLAERREKTRTILNRARRRLLELGFSEELIQEHIQEREVSVAHHACRLADMKKVDAVVVPKKITSSLEGFLKGNPAPDFLHHCLVSPIWFVEGRPSTERAVIAVGLENASLRAVDHAGFMLAETKTAVDLLHVTGRVSRAISSGIETKSREYLDWISQSKNREVRTFMEESARILINAGITPERIRLVIHPGKNVADSLLDYCKMTCAGIVVLGHSKPGGTWGFLKSTITERLISSAINLSVWVNQ